MKKEALVGFILWVSCMLILSVCTIPFRGTEFAVKTLAVLMGLSVVGFIIISVWEMFK